MALALAGIRVLAIEQFGAGPFSTLQLADLGAEVIKIEDPSSGGDVGRYVPPYQEADESLYFESLNRNKKSVSLDLRVPSGRAVFEDMVRTADVVFSNLRGDQPKKLRIMYDDLAAFNPRIVCCSLSGFGNTGPRAAQGGYDYMMQGMAGWMAMTGEPDGPPTKSGLSLVDLSGGYLAAIAMLAAIVRVRRDGVGCDCDIALFETALAQLSYVGTWAATEGWQPQRMAESAHPSIVPFQAFRAADGWLVVACAKEKFWRLFCGVIERPGLLEDTRFSDFEARDASRETLLPILREALAQRTVADWVERLVAGGVPSAPVQGVGEALLDPQVAAREMVITTTHPRFGDVRSIASPLHLSGDRLRAVRAPRQGEHTRQALVEICGYSEARLGELVEEGAIRLGAAEVSGQS
jgi:crotonobetainyl-CoA:carnitine CoA-transferase CaiB-like acyl-CoA transferase